MKFRIHVSDFSRIIFRMSKFLFVEYPRCSTCQRAKKFLEEKGVDFEARHIVENPPSIEELRAWITRSGLPLKKFFNTSGLRYKALALKDKLPVMSEDEQIALLASDGMLIKRPLLISNASVCVGFKESAWETSL